MVKIVNDMAISVIDTVVHTIPVCPGNVENVEIVTPHANVTLKIVKCQLFQILV